MDGKPLINMKVDNYLDVVHSTTLNCDWQCAKAVSTEDRIVGTNNTASIYKNQKKIHKIAWHFCKALFGILL